MKKTHTRMLSQKALLCTTILIVSLLEISFCLPMAGPDVSEAMINDVLMSIKRLIESENNGFDRDFHSNINTSNDLKKQDFSKVNNNETIKIKTFNESNSSNNSSEHLVNATVSSTNLLETRKTEEKSTTTPTTTTKLTTTKTSTTTTTTTTTTSSTMSLFDILTTEEESEEKREELCDTEPNNSLLRNGLGSTGYTWPDGKIPYVISSGFNETQKELIETAIDYYNTEFSGCIEWIKHTDQPSNVIFENTGSCSSRIGVAFYPLPLAQTINIGRCSHLLGHIKHEMMHTIGFYHEHSRSDRDKYIEIEWNNIPLEYQAQFTTYRWTVGYGEKYDYESIMHYSSRAFVRDYSDKNMRSIVPKDKSIDPDTLGFKPNLSETDKIKIRKMYKCAPYNDYKVSCSTDDECGLNEYCTAFVGECRTKLPDGSVCFTDRECLNHCSGGVCSLCEQDGHCDGGQYCAYKYLPAIENECSGFCDSYCFFSSQCGGDCTTCTWSFTCQKN